ncbi:NADH-quinone oxidoreductase subunit M [Alphaproteobacteria bacterium]|nr:NADH-quinone oxidoreductase subunit M [Alphaproteobacteria bacterium]
MNIPILSTLIFLPIICAVFLLIVRFKNSKIYFGYGLVVSILNLFLAIILTSQFDLEKKEYQFSEVFKLFSLYDIKYFVGVDGISLAMIILTAILTPICLAISVNSIKTRVKEFVIAFLIMEGLVIGSFCALDILFFYMFFEFMLIPMFLLIGIWGGENRVYASYKFFIYTLFGSVFFLIAIITMFLYTGTTDVVQLAKGLPKYFPLEYQKIFFIAFALSFAVKIPMFPFHTWLPDAHVQAPTAGSVILAGILIKLGAYGFLRFALPLFPLGAQYFANAILVLSVIAIIYGSFVALMQEDMKKMIAYSSVAHMGFVTMGIFSFTQQGIDGAVFQMISHGIVSAGLFMCVGSIYDRLHTKKIADLGGIALRMPNFALIAMILTLASVGLPGTSGFVGEFLAIIGTFKVNKILALIASLGVILGACYMLWLYKRVWFSEISNSKVTSLTDVKNFELLSYVVMVSIVILIGIFPNLIIKYYTHPVSDIVKIFSENLAK